MNLDILAGPVCCWVAVCIFAMHVFSDPDHPGFANAPEYVRVGILVTGILFFWRGVNFFSVAHSPVFLGHINAEGMMPLFGIAYTSTVMAFWICRHKLPAVAWDRIRFVFGEISVKPTLAAAVMTDREVAQELRATGTPTVEANEPPSAVWREGAPRHPLD